MTPNEELWAAVVANCATGRGYRMTLDEGCRLTLTRGNEPSVYVESLKGEWIVFVGSKPVASRYHADEAVRAALRIVAPSTEPNVSC